MRGKRNCTVFYQILARIRGKTEVKKMTSIVLVRFTKPDKYRN